MRAKKYGVVGVDSGQLIIVDPSMAQFVNAHDTFLPGGKGMPDGKELEFPSSVTFNSGHGDGDYPVYGIYDYEGYHCGTIVWFFSDVPFPFEVVE